MMIDLPTAVCSKVEDRSHVSWYLSHCERCFTTAFSPEKLLSLKLQFKYPSLQGAEISKQMSPSMKPHPHVVLLAAWRRWCCCSYLNGGINKPKTLVLNQFRVPIADQILEKPTYFGLLTQLQALSTEFWFCGPVCVSWREKDHNILATWHGDRQPWHSQTDRQIPAGFEGAGQILQCKPNIQDEKLNKYPKLRDVPATQTKGYRQLQHTCTRSCDGTDWLSL